MSGDSSQQEQGLSRRGALKAALWGLVGLGTPESVFRAGKEVQRGEFIRKHRGEIPPFTDPRDIPIDTEYVPPSPQAAPFTESDFAESGVDFGKFNFMTFANAQFSDGTPAAIHEFYLPDLGQVKRGDQIDWNFDPNEFEGFRYKEIYGLRYSESNTPDWKPPHNRKWQVSPGHWPPKDEFWSSPEVIQIHNKTFNLKRGNGKDIAYLPSVYEMLQLQALGEAERTANVRGWAEQHAGKIIMYSKAKPNGTQGLIGDPSAPYLELTVVDKQVIPLDQENDIHQISGLVKDEEGNTLFAIVSCYPLDKGGNGEDTTERYVMWVKARKITPKTTTNLV